MSRLCFDVVGRDQLAHQHDDLDGASMRISKHLTRKSVDLGYIPTTVHARIGGLRPGRIDGTCVRLHAPGAYTVELTRDEVVDLVRKLFTSNTRAELRKLLESADRRRVKQNSFKVLVAPCTRKHVAPHAT